MQDFGTSSLERHKIDSIEKITEKVSCRLVVNEHLDACVLNIWVVLFIRVHACTYVLFVDVGKHVLAAHCAFMHVYACIYVSVFVCMWVEFCVCAGRWKPFVGITQYLRYLSVYLFIYVCIYIACVYIHYVYKYIIYIYMCV